MKREAEEVKAQLNSKPKQKELSAADKEAQKLEQMKKLMAEQKAKKALEAEAKAKIENKKPEKP